MGAILTSARMSAAQGYEMGFVNEVTPQADLKAAVERWCDEILLGAPMAIRASKDAVMRGLDEPGLEAAISGQEDYPAYKAWKESEDLKEGPRAFAEKRSPVWKGR